MQKTLTIDGKEIAFKSTGATPLRYKMQFGKDFFAEVLKMEKAIPKDKGGEIDPSQLDFEVIYNIAWSLAKTADSTIPDPLTWLDGFDEFPIMDIFTEVQEMVMATIAGKKK